MLPFAVNLVLAVATIGFIVLVIRPEEEAKQGLDCFLIFFRVLCLFQDLYVTCLSSRGLSGNCNVFLSSCPAVGKLITISSRDVIITHEFGSGDCKLTTARNFVFF